MIVYEIAVNQHRVLAGAPDQTSLSLRLNAGEGFAAPQLSVSAFRVSDQRFEKHYRWEFSPISIGDEVIIRVLEQASADSPTKVDTSKPVLSTDEKAMLRHEVAKVRRLIAELTRTASQESKATASQDSTALYCSFCGRSQHEVKKLIAGPSVYICDECTAECVKLQQES